MGVLLFLSGPGRKLIEKKCYSAYRMCTNKPTAKGGNRTNLMSLPSTSAKTKFTFLVQYTMCELQKWGGY